MPSNINANILAPKQHEGDFADLWSRFYQGTDNEKKEARVRLVLAGVLKENKQIPQGAQNAINVAADIFAGNMGVPRNRLVEVLEKTGWGESNYSNIRQLDRKTGRPSTRAEAARGYWQVEPRTAMNLIVSAPALFGPKFQGNFSEKGRFEVTLEKQGKKLFGRDALKAMNVNEMGHALESNHELAAAMSAAKWIQATSKQPYMQGKAPSHSWVLQPFQRDLFIYDENSSDQNIKGV